MCYHWGLGVGHFHAHQLEGTSGLIPEDPNAEDVQSLDSEIGKEVPQVADVDTQNQDGNDSDVCESDDELGLEDRNVKGWDNVESEDSGGNDLDDMDLEEEDFTGI
jgi:hypothetical protein